MCMLCAPDGTMQGCQDCGCLICFDEAPGYDGLVDRAYVSASGDVSCQRCGRRADADAEEGGSGG